MTLQMVQVLMQSLSSLCIAGSLIYAAFQFRAARNSTQVANFTRLVELQMQLRRMRVEDPSLAYVYKHDVANLKSDQEIREYFMNLMQLSIFEIVWFGHRHGTIPDDYFESWAKRMEAIKTEESFRKMMENPSMKILHDEFDAYVRRLIDSKAPTREFPIPLS